jgi:hypothetical protein
VHEFYGSAGKGPAAGLTQGYWLARPRPGTKRKQFMKLADWATRPIVVCYDIAQSVCRVVGLNRVAFDRSS